MDPFRTPDAIEIGSVTGITSVEKLAGIDTLVWEGALLGLLPSGVKRALHERYGFSPLATTRFTVFVELALLPFLFVALLVPSGLLFVYAALFADVFFRVSILFDDSYPTFGFFEWVVQPQLGAVVGKGWSAIRARLGGPRGGPRD